MVPKVFRCSVAVALLCALVPAVATAQTLNNRGSTLASPANGNFGCETVWRPTPASPPGTPFTAEASNFPSCTWLQTGAAAFDRTGNVPVTMGTVTKVRIKSGPTPAPLSIVILRRRFQVNQNNEITGDVCCEAMQESATFNPTPNAITEVVVDLPSDAQSAEYQKKTGIQDIVAVSGQAAGTPGNPAHLPIADVGPHTLDPFATITADSYYPAIRKGQVNQGTQFANNFEVLLQFDWCRNVAAARQACGGGGGGTTPTPTPTPTPTVPGGGTTTPPPTNATQAGEVRSTKLTLSGSRVGVGVKCDTPTGAQCAGSVRLRTRGGKKTYVLASRRLTMNDGQTATVQLALGKTARKRLKKKTNKVTVEVDFGAAGRTTKALNLRRK